MIEIPVLLLYFKWLLGGRMVRFVLTKKNSPAQQDFIFTDHNKRNHKTVYSRKKLTQIPYSVSPALFLVIVLFF